MASPLKEKMSGYVATNAQLGAMMIKHSANRSDRFRTPILASNCFPCGDKWDREIRRNYDVKRYSDCWWKIRTRRDRISRCIWEDSAPTTIARESHSIPVGNLELFLLYATHIRWSKGKWIETHYWEYLWHCISLAACATRLWSLRCCCRL